jgi:protocatechuate 3,4-dioxygenase beta subunit
MNFILLSIALLSSHITIAGPHEPGQRLVISGRVVDDRGHGVAGVEIRAYHTDARGLYRNDDRPYGDNAPPRLQGRLRTASDGSYTIETIRPAPYPNRSLPAHVHIELHPPGGGNQYAIIYFADDALLSATERAKNPRAVCSPTRTPDRVLHCARDFHLGKETE